MMSSEEVCIAEKRKDATQPTKSNKKSAIQPATLTKFSKQSGHAKPVCIFPLSILQNYHKSRDHHKDGKLESLIMAINNNYSYCKVIRGNTLQRYNFILLGETSETAYQKSLAEDTKYTDETAEAFKLLTIPHDTSGWNNWMFGKENVNYAEFEKIENILEKIKALKENEKSLSREEFLIKANVLIEQEQELTKENKEYLKKRTMVNDAYENEPKFKRIAQKAILGFLSKLSDDFSIGSDLPNRMNIVTNYILEELAVFLIWNEKIAEEFKGKGCRNEGEFSFVYPLKCSNTSRMVADAFAELPAMKNGKMHIYFQDAVPPGYKKGTNLSSSSEEENRKTISSSLDIPSVTITSTSRENSPPLSPKNLSLLDGSADISKNENNIIDNPALETNKQEMPPSKNSPVNAPEDTSGSFSNSFNEEILFYQPGENQTDCNTQPQSPPLSPTKKTSISLHSKETAQQLFTSSPVCSPLYGYNFYGLYGNKLGLNEDALKEASALVIRESLQTLLNLGVQNSATDEQINIISKFTSQTIAHLNQQPPNHNSNTIQQTKPPIFTNQTILAKEELTTVAQPTIK